MKKCLNCGAEYEDSYKFCQKCGSKLEPFVEKEEENVDTEVQDESTDAEVSSKSNENEDEAFSEIQKEETDVKDSQEETSDEEVDNPKEENVLENMPKIPNVPPVEEKEGIVK